MRAYHYTVRFENNPGFPQLSVYVYKAEWEILEDKQPTITHTLKKKLMITAYQPGSSI